MQLYVQKLYHKLNLHAIKIMEVTAVNFKETKFTVRQLRVSHRKEHLISSVFR